MTDRRRFPVVPEPRLRLQIQGREKPQAAKLWQCYRAGTSETTNRNKNMKRAAGIYTEIISPNAFFEAGYQLTDMQLAMLDATPDCIKVLSVDGNLLTMNKAGCLALSVPTDSDFGMPWLPLLAEDVRELGAEALREAAEGRSARFPGKSQSPDQIIYWDNLLTPLVDASGRVRSILCVSRDVTARTQIENQLEDAIIREKLLSKEMHHRVKNLFSLVSSLISFAEKEAAKDFSQENATYILREKLNALARASDAAFAEGVVEDAAGQVNLQTLISAVLEPYGDRCAMIGNKALVYRNTLTTLALLLHELATNSVKYGALSTEEGKVTIRWMVTEAALNLTWRETGGPIILAPPKHAGFGGKMVDRIVHSSGGKIEREWRAEGFIADLYFPNLVHD